MNKKNFINKLSIAYDMTKQQAAKVVDLFFNEMAAALEKGDRFELCTARQPAKGTAGWSGCDQHRNVWAPMNIILATA